MYSEYAVSKRVSNGELKMITSWFTNYETALNRFEYLVRTKSKISEVKYILLERHVTPVKIIEEEE